MSKQEILENIKKREEILKRAPKITNEERCWVLTNPYYNETDTQYLHTDIINIEPNKWYDIEIKSIDKIKDQFLEIVINIPMGKGEIRADFNVFDFYEKEKPCKNITMLGIDNQSTDAKHIKVMSNIGIIGIYYRVVLFNRAVMFNRAMARNIPISSGDSKVLYMKKEQVSENIIKYYCKTNDSIEVPDNEEFIKHGFEIKIQ